MTTRTQPRVVTLVLVLTLALSSLVVVRSAAPAAAAEEVYAAPVSGSWTVSGRAFGHGIGLSQWGSQGAALAGLTADQILDFYYPGTAVGNVGSPSVRVQLTAYAGTAVTFAPAGTGSTVTDTATGASVTVTANQRLRTSLAPSGLLVVTDVATGTPFTFGAATAVAGPLELASPSGTWLTAADGASVRYPGTVRLLRASPGIQVVDVLPLEEYLRGVVPRESPSSWQPAALRAQSVAARSYALAVSTNGASWDLCDTTMCQVYGGSASRTAAGAVTELYATSTDAAVAATAGQVRTYGGVVAFTQFSSSNGGYSVAGSRPYLVARADPYSGTAPGDPATTWTRTLTVARVQQECPSGGTLRQLAITGRTGQGALGGRITSLRVDCTTGSRTVTGSSALSMGMLSPWWAPQQLDGAPLGRVDTIYAASGGIGIAGWAIDPGTSAPIDVRVTYGSTVATIRADGSRPDIANAFPGQGPLHGFGQVFAAPPGATTVCVTAVNVGPGQDTPLGCWSLTVPVGAPQGALEQATAGPGTITVSGWAYDTDAGGPIGVHVYIGSTMVPLTADQVRPDLPAVPGATSARGYRTTVKVAPGTHRVCVFAIAVPQPSDNPTLGCKDVTVAGGSPFGSIDYLAGAVGGIAVSGWAIDPDTSGSVYAWIDVSGSGMPILASGSRPDVARVYPGFDAHRGYSGIVPVPGGTYRVCVTLVNVGAGTNAALGCRSVTVPGGSPFGNVDTVARVPGGIAVAGWAIDPDTTSAGYVWVSVGDAGTPVYANVPRTDVNSAYPGYGERHGFATVIPARSGAQRVCVTLVNTGLGADSLLLCRTL